MRIEEKEHFAALLSGVMDFYSKETSLISSNIWWEAMKLYDFKAVNEAMYRHVTNPDNGQYAPKPANIIRLLEGSTQDSAMGAWAKVHRAMREIGPYQSVVFDDAIIHAVITDMGGWILFGNFLEDELPFKGKEFENRYRGFMTKGMNFKYIRKLRGITDQINKNQGYPEEDPMMIGNAQKAQLVFENGADENRLSYERLNLEKTLTVIRLENMKVIEEEKKVA